MAAVKPGTILSSITIPGTVLAAVPPLLYVYMPRPPLPGAHLLVYPIVAGVLVVLGSLLVGRRSTVDRQLLVTALLCLLLGGIAGLSALLNSAYVRATAPLDILRPVVLLIFFVYGYYVVHHSREEDAQRGLLAAAYIILAGQFAIATLQFLGLSFVDVLYAEHKARPFGSLLRITGSLTNPNAFGWIVSQATVLIMLLTSQRIRYLALVVGTVLVLVSGSRSVLVIFPLMVAVAFFLRPAGRMRLSWSAAAYTAGIGAAMVAAVVAFSDYFPYLAELWYIVETGSLLSVNSFAIRVEGWQRVYAEFRAAGHTAWLVGLGSRESTGTLDNEFLYVLFRIGTLGLAIHFALLGYLCFLFLMQRASAIAKVGLQYLFFALLFGITVDTLGGWFFPLLLFYFAGLTAGLRADESTRQRDYALQMVRLRSNQQIIAGYRDSA